LSIPAPRLEDIPLDIAFAVDSSEDISAANWNLILQYLLAMVDGIGNVSPSARGTRFGAVSYATAPVVGFKFNALSGPQLNAGEVKQLIQSLPRQKGTDRRIDLAIQAVDRDLFSTAGGARSGARKVRDSEIMIIGRSVWCMAQLSEGCSISANPGLTVSVFTTQTLNSWL